MDENAFTILCVDDEQSILNALKRLLRKEKYNLLFANSGKEGLEILKTNHVDMVISDQRMPEMNGTDFLAMVKDKYPNVIRIILTGYSDIDSITESINKGNIFKFFFKPWNDLRLKSELRQIIEQLDLVQTNKRLDETIVQQNLALEKMSSKLIKGAGKGFNGDKLQDHTLELSQAILEDLPISVMGIDAQGVIVMTNKVARTLVCAEGVKPGDSLSAYFSRGVVDKVQEVIATGEAISLSEKFSRHQSLDAVLLPFSGEFQGKGVIMTMNLSKTE